MGGDGGGIFLQRVEAVGVESLRRIFSLRDDDLASGLRVYADLNRGHHGLARKLVGAGLSVEKDPPFTVDFSDASMGIAVGRGRGNGFSFGVDVASAGVDYGASVGEGSERIVAVGIGEGVVGARQTKLPVGRPATEDEDVLAIDFPHRGCFIEPERPLLLESADDVGDNLRARFDRGHRLWVEFGGHGVAESPVAVDAAVVVDKYGGVEAQHSVGLAGVVSAPVYDLKGPVGTVGSRHHAVSAPLLVVGIEEILLASVGQGSLRHVGRVEHVAASVLMKEAAVAVFRDLQDFPVMPPAVE